MNTVVKDFPIRKLMIALALSSSVFLSACTFNGGGSTNNTQNSTPVVKEEKGNTLDKFNGSVNEPAESPEKEQPEKQESAESNEPAESPEKEQPEKQEGVEGNEGKTNQERTGN